MVELRRHIGEHRADILLADVGKVLGNFGGSRAARKHVEHVRHAHPRAGHDRSTAAHRRVDADAGKAVQGHGRNLWRSPSEVKRPAIGARHHKVDWRVLDPVACLSQAADRRCMAELPLITGGMYCFCNAPVDEGGLDPCTLSIATNREGWQSWPCHAACYRQRLGDLPYARDLFDDTDN